MGTKESIKEEMDDKLNDNEVVDEVKECEEVEKNDELSVLKEQLEEKDKALAELKDQMLRLRADTENYKKRLIRDKEDAVKFANASLIKDLLGIMDDFKRAIDVSANTKDFDAMYDGIKMIDDRFYSVLKTNWGLVEIGEEGDAFDANEHEACMVAEDEGAEKETVSQVFQKGYKLHGRVIRAAKVKVIKPSN